jgi:uncharacterized protein YceH (UPF0502 family)
MNDVEQRIEALEKEVAALKQRPSPRGPAGDITAAIAGAAHEVSNAEARVQSVANAEYRKFAAEVKALRKEIEALKKYLDERITNAVDNQVVQVLRDYHLLDANNTPAHWKK